MEARSGRVLDQPIARPFGARLKLHLQDRLLLAIVAIEFVVLYLPTLAWLFERWTTSVWHNIHGLVIPLVVAYFVWRELRHIGDADDDASAWGFLFLVPALVLLALDAGMHTQLLSAASLILALPGLALLFLGKRRTRAIALPLAFATLMLPVPLVLIERLQLGLRRLATGTAASVVHLVGVPVFAEGTTLHLPGVSLLVGDGCSGFSTLYASVAVAGLTAYSSSAGTRRRLLVVLAAVPLAIAANLVRVTVLALLVVWQGQRVLQTWLHPVSGMVTFMVVVPLIVYLGEPSSRGPRSYDFASIQ